MQFRKDINGLRAIAVIAVVLFHFNASWVPGGFAGVDVFFVISGFLMTGIIFRGIEQSNFSILKFYVARANRIVPALGLLCLVLLVSGWFYLLPLDYAALGKHAFSSITFLSNVVYWQESGYFDAASHEKWLLHTWSLSVEWQFYIIYPLVLVAMRKFMSIKTVKASVVIGSTLGFIFCVIATYKWPNPAYYLLPTRMWEMMIGGVAYLYPLSLKEERKKILERLGLALLIGSCFLISKENYWPGYLALFPVLGTFLIIQAQRNNSYVTSNIISQKIGAWSYSIYLWHWPIVVVIYTYSLSERFVYLGITLSIFLGYLSHKYVEKIKFKNDFNSLLSHLTCKPVFIILFISAIGSYNWIERNNTPSLVKNTLSEEEQYLSKYHNDNYKKYLPEAYSEHCNFFDASSYTAKTDDIPDACTNNGTGGIFIWGDSHAQALSYGIRTVFPDININQVASSACRPLTKNETKLSGEFKVACDRSNAKAKKAILRIEPEVILLAQHMDHHENEYAEILAYVKHNNLKSKIVLIGPVPQWKPSLPKAIVKRHFNKNKKIINDASFVSKVLEINTRLHAKYNTTEISHVSLIDDLCKGKNCLAKVDNQNTPLVWDYGHLTLAGSVYVINKIVKDEIMLHLTQ